MQGLYLIPDKEHMAESSALRKEQGASYEYNDFYLPGILSDKKEQLRIIEEYAKWRNDFSTDTIHGAFLDVTLHSMDTLIREASEQRVRQSMEVAKEMGARGVVFHTNRIYRFREKKYLANWKRANEAFFKKLAEEFPKQEILLENMFDEAADVLAELAESMREVPNFGICLDYAHAAVFSDTPEEWLRQLAPFIRHMHINDNDRKEDLHLPVGQGVIDWKEFEAVRKACDIKASVLLEVSGSRKQQQSLQYMKEHEICERSSYEGIHS